MNVTEGSVHPRSSWPTTRRHSRVPHRTGRHCRPSKEDPPHPGQRVQPPGPTTRYSWRRH